MSQAAAADPHISISLPTVDWPALIPQLVGYFFQGVATYVNDALHSVFDGMWGSGANVISQTDLAMTWDPADCPVRWARILTNERTG